MVVWITKLVVKLPRYAELCDIINGYLCVGFRAALYSDRQQLTQIRFLIGESNSNK